MRVKAWTDEECFALIEQEIGRVADGFDLRPRDLYPLIRAAVDEARAEHHADCTKGTLLLVVEARREEREACAAAARAAKYGASMSIGERNPTDETQNFAADWGDAITERIVAAILARESRNAER